MNPEIREGVEEWGTSEREYRELFVRECEITDISRFFMGLEDEGMFLKDERT